MLHHDKAVDTAMRANIGAGYHFFDPDNQRFHRSSSVAGFISTCGNFVFVVERYRTARMGGVVVQTPHSRVVRVSLADGSTDYMTEEGKPTSEMIAGRYVNNGEACHFSDNGLAKIYAAKWANESPYTAKKGDTVRLATGGSMTGIVRRVDARRALPVIVEWANGSHGPTSHKSLRKVTP